MRSWGGELLRMREEVWWGDPRYDRRLGQPRPAPRDAAAAGAAVPQSWVVAWALLSTVHHTLTAGMRMWCLPDQCGWVGKYLDT